MLPRASSYEELCSRFRWDIPEFYNIGVDVCDRWAATEPERLALIDVGAEGDRAFTYRQLRDLSNQTANLLRAHGIARGDRVGILLPQTPETAYAHIAAYKLGAIAIPLFTLFGAEALEHRLGNSGARAIVTNREGAGKLAALRDRLPELQLVLDIDGASEAASDFHAIRGAQSTAFDPVDTRADDPALIIYTSGTTGLPKGALHAHRVLLGHLPGVEMSHDLLPQPGDRIWTPADWAWIGGLLDVLLPALHHGVPVVARRFNKFTGEAAFELIRKYGIRNAFLPPTALKMMHAVAGPGAGRQVEMRSVASGGETVGAELLAWGREVLGVTINEFYGQTECNMIVSSCAAVMDVVPGVMGQPVPGHDVAVIGEDGRPAPSDVQGMIAVKRPDPVMMLGYWADDEATRRKFLGDWLITGDQGAREPDGRIRFIGRDDDVITSAGYRIGPGEIEDFLMRHPAVEMAAAVGKPDALRGEIVKAYVVLKTGFARSDDLARELAGHVKARLAAHEYPREVAFLDSLPLTTTGKIIRRELRQRASEETGRSDQTPSAAITIRDERPADRGAILQLNRDAFGSDGEPELIEKLHADGLVAASLVAEDDGRIIGHILLSWLSLEMDGCPLSGLALAPMAVAPARQRQGTGSRLVEAAVEAARRIGADAIIVLGHPGFYPRFGFSAQAAAKLLSPFTGEAFMALELAPGALAGQRGTVVYPAAFGLEPDGRAPTSH